MLLLAGVVGGLLSPGITPADAQQVVRADPRGDVWEPRGFHGWKRAETAPNVDTRGFRLANGEHRVVIKARYTDLVANEDELMLSVDFKSGATERTVSAQVGPGEREGYFVVSTVSDRVECDVAGSVDYQAETIRIVVPHHCIGQGDWFRFDVKNCRFNEGTGVLCDDPMTRRGDTFAWSAKLYRGAAARSDGSKQPSHRAFHR